MNGELLKKDGGKVLFLIKHQLHNCENLLKPKIDYYFDSISGNLSDEELEYANILYSLYDRIDGVLEYVNSLNSNKND